MAAKVAYWDQSRFDAALKLQMATLDGNSIPGWLNKKAFFLALRAASETPKKDPFEISRELSKQIVATRADGTTSQIPIAWAMIAKRVSASWKGKKRDIAWKAVERMGKRISKPRFKKQYLRMLRKRLDAMLGGRRKAAGFLAVGWVSVLRSIRPFVRGLRFPSESETGARVRGGPKGEAKPARPSSHIVRLISSAQAKSDKRNGLLRFGAPALQRAFDKETADITRHLDSELKADFTKTNAELK